MNFWEQLGLTIFQAILAQIKFDPAKHQGLAHVLIPIRDTLLILYPLTSPTPPVPPAA